MLLLLLNVVQLHVLNFLQGNFELVVDEVVYFLELDFELVMFLYVDFLLFDYLQVYLHELFPDVVAETLLLQLDQFDIVDP